MMTDAAESETTANESDNELDGVEEVIKAPSLKEARQQFQSLATFLADNAEYTAQDEVLFQKLSDKAAKMLVTNINAKQQSSITGFFP